MKHYYVANTLAYSAENFFNSGQIAKAAFCCFVALEVLNSHAKALELKNKIERDSKLSSYTENPFQFKELLSNIDFQNLPISGSPNTRNELLEAANDLVLHGNIYENKQELGKAMVFYHAALEFIPLHVRALISKAKLFENTNDFESAIRLYLAANRIKNYDYFPKFSSAVGQLLSSQDFNHITLRQCFLGAKELSHLANCMKENNVCLKITAFDLSGNGLNDNNAKLFENFLKDNSTLQNLNLSHNAITRSSESLFINFIKTSSSIQEINLSYNRIDHMGAENLIKATRNHPSMRQLNFHNNIIDGDEKDIEKLDYELQNSPLTCIDISQNYIGCTGKTSSIYKQIQKPRSKPYKNLLLKHHIFRTNLQEVPSLLDARRKLDRENWIVALACKKEGEHAMLFIEGIRSYGQRFLQMADLKLENGMLYGKGRVSIQLYNIEPFIHNQRNYDSTAWPVPRILAKRLQRNIIRQEGEVIPFFELASSSALSSTDIAYNCLTWALKQLDSIDIHIERGWLTMAFPMTSQLIQENNKNSNLVAQTK